jgi:hypothetical protein
MIMLKKAKEVMELGIKRAAFAGLKAKGDAGCEVSQVVAGAGLAQKRTGHK